jgi:hypothetical protein
MPPMAMPKVTPASLRTWALDLVSGGPTRLSRFCHCEGAPRKGLRMTGIWAAASSAATLMVLLLAVRREKSCWNEEGLLLVRQRRH